VSGRLRFLLDEHIPFAVAQGLRRRGIDVTTAVETGLTGADDEILLEFARQAGRFLVTQDEDFLRLHSRGVPHRGLAYYKQGSRTVSEVLQILTLIHDLMMTDHASGQLIYL